MVWIYGGGFTGGSGGMAWYDGQNLAAKGPVIVTFNYRLGSLGFFAHPELAAESGRHAAGNYGMMDAIAALQWVKRNISAFGGDPNNVTIAGESAGAIMVGALVGSPVAKGLFHRAIAESGGWMGLTMGRMTPGETALANGQKTMEAPRREDDCRAARQAAQRAHRTLCRWPRDRRLSHSGRHLADVRERQAERRRRAHRVE
jgi:para-nitrobenzyl esterase